MNELITINNVRGYLDKNGTAHLNLEDVARGLGFTETKSGKEYVMWRRVYGYLAEFGFSAQVPKDEIGVPPLVGEKNFIPENIFYKLCFKASNETARRFQDTVTDEVLPSIRKHGAYLTPETIEKVLQNPDTIINIAMQLKTAQGQVRALEAAREQDKPKIIFAEAVSVSNTSILVGELAKILKQNGIEIGQNRLFEWLRANGYLIKRKGTDYNMPTQYSMELGLFEIKETSISHSDGHVSINKTPKVTGKGQIYFVNEFKVKTA